MACLLLSLSNVVAPKKILVVEDDLPTRAAIAAALRAEGYDVAVTSEHQHACDLASRQPAELVVTDLTTPQLDGVELIGELRAAKPDLRVIVVTSANGARLAELLCAAAHFEKPVKLDALLEGVAALLCG